MENLLRFAESIKAEVITMEFESSAKGMMKGRKDGTYIIAIRHDLAKEDIPFTLAHELAHIYLHFDKGNTIASPHRTEYEEQADRAAKLLLDFMEMQNISAAAKEKAAPQNSRPKEKGAAKSSNSILTAE